MELQAKGIKIVERVLRLSRASHPINSATSYFNPSVASFGFLTSESTSRSFAILLHKGSPMCRKRRPKLPEKCSPVFSAAMAEPSADPAAYEVHLAFKSRLWSKLEL